MAIGFFSRYRDRAAHRTYAAIPQGAGALDLTVLDPVGLPMPGAGISLKSSGNRKVVRGETDPHGMFTANLPPAEYQVLVTCDGFRPIRFNASTSPGARSVLPPLTLDLAPAPPLPAPGHWAIDPAHTSVRFVARHIGLAEVHGRFNAFQGALLIAPNIEQSQIDVVIDAASIDTNVQMRDDHLRSADFLNVERYPYLRFESNRFVHRGGSQWSVQGALQLHGMRRSVSLDTRYLGLGTGMEDELRVACNASAELHREDFTLDWRKMLSAGIAVVGATIRIELDIQAIRMQ
jgi:polyisoprenoid-binding protein YceI